jgi:hypothetical protein
MRMDRKIYDFAPGTVIVVGPNGRLVIGEKSGSAAVEMHGCTYFTPDRDAPGVKALRDYAWSQWDDTGTKRTGPTDGVSVNPR